MTDAFDALLLNEQANMFKYARHLTRRKDRAEELVQDTYVRALNCQHLFQMGTDFSGWLAVVMRHLFLDQIKKSKRSYVVIDSALADTVLAYAVDDPCRIVEARDAIRHLDDLPAATRTLLLMSSEGIPLEDMAKSQGVPLGTVKSRINRGREMFHRILGDQVPA